MKKIKKLGSGIFHIDAIFFPFAQNKRSFLPWSLLPSSITGLISFFSEDHCIPPCRDQTQIYNFINPVKSTDFIAECRALSELGRTETFKVC